MWKARACGACVVALVACQLPIHADGFLLTSIGTLPKSMPMGVSAIRVGPLKAVWSNPQETVDYMLKIEGKGPKETHDQPSAIVGVTPMGKAIKDMGTEQDVLVECGAELPDSIRMPNGDVFSEYPIYVTVPAWEVEDVIKWCPAERRADLVFMQTDNMEDLLKRYGLCRKEQTQALPFFTISPIGRPIEQRRQYDVSPVTGEPKFIAETVVCGKWRGAVAERLQRKGLFCEPLDYTYWRKHMLERAIFDSAFNLIGSVHKGEKTYGDVAEYHTEEVEDIITELSSCVRNTQAVVLLSGTQERLLALAKSERFKDVKTRMPTEQEYFFRNGYFRRITYEFVSRGFRSLASTHDEYLSYASEQGLIPYPIDPPEPQY